MKYIFITSILILLSSCALLDELLLPPNYGVVEDKRIVVEDKRIGTPYKFENLEIGQNEIYRGQYESALDYKYDEALIDCQSLGNNWRLPTINELQRIYEYKLQIYGYNDWPKYQYWSSSKNNKGKALFLIMGNGEVGNEGDWTKCFVIVVRDIKK